MLLEERQRQLVGKDIAAVMVGIHVPGLVSEPRECRAISRLTANRCAACGSKAGPPRLCG